MIDPIVYNAKAFMRRKDPRFRLKRHGRWPWRGKRWVSSTRFD